MASAAHAPSRRAHVLGGGRLRSRVGAARETAGPRCGGGAGRSPRAGSGAPAVREGRGPARPRTRRGGEPAAAGSLAASSRLPRSARRARAPPRVARRRGRAPAAFSWAISALIRLCVSWRRIIGPQARDRVGVHRHRPVDLQPDVESTLGYLARASAHARGVARDRAGARSPLRPARPARPSSGSRCRRRATTSSQPGALTATAGSPQAAASASTRPCVSVSEAKRKTSAA